MNELHLQGWLCHDHDGLIAVKDDKNASAFGQKAYKKVSVIFSMVLIIMKMTHLVAGVILYQMFL